MSHPEEYFTEKMSVCEVRIHENLHFLGSCKIHTCLLDALAFLGRTTHYHVSWFLALQINNLRQLVIREVHILSYNYSTE